MKHQNDIENPSTKVEKEKAAEQIEESVEQPTTDTSAAEVSPQTGKPASAGRGEDIDSRLSEAQSRIEDLKDKNLRMMAEFENFRKRTAKEKLELQATAGERIFGDMLSLIDDFERAEKAMAASDDVNALREGLDLIHKKFIAFLEKHDVRAIETENQPFDVDRHEAITTLDAGEDKKGQIIDCTQKGYTLGDKVIRYAKVVVGA